MNQIQYIIYKILRKTGARREDILGGKDFRKELGFDSLEILYMANQIEIYFHITIPDEDISRFTNMNNTVKYLSEKLYV